MSAALLCPRSRTQNERAFELRSQRVRHLHRQRSGRVGLPLEFGMMPRRLLLNLPTLP